MRMKRRRLPEIAVAMAAMLAAGCAREDVGPAAYAAEDCRRVALIDQATGERVRGAEDFAVDRRRGLLYVAAYDRRAVERAVSRRALSVPQGGVYITPLAALFDPTADEASVAPMLRPQDVAGGLRPHGISFDPATGEAAFINRAYNRLNGGWAMTPRVERAGVNGAVYVGAARPAPCSANSLLEEGGRTLVSFDHGECGWRAGLEDMFRLKRSGVAAADGEVLFAGAAFANGLARTHDGHLALAATRENAVLLMRSKAEGLVETGRIDLPGGPDNLTLADDGGVVAAVHPSMFRIFLDRRHGIGRAPSRIVKAYPDSGSVELLFDDPSGRVFAAATVAAQIGDYLVAGSVTDEGLLVCSKASE